jgi:hypothetical protein
LLRVVLKLLAVPLWNAVRNDAELHFNDVSCASNCH